MNGRDKLMELVDGKPLLQVVTERASATKQPVFVAVPDTDHPRAKVIRSSNAKLLPIPASAEGQGVTLREAVSQLPDTDAFMVLLADMPEITTHDMLAVMKAKQEHPEHVIWRGASSEGKAGHPVLFDAILKQQFGSLCGDQGGASIVKEYAVNTYLVLLTGDHATLDLDTPQDWERWRSRQE